MNPAPVKIIDASRSHRQSRSLVLTPRFASVELRSHSRALIPSLTLRLSLGLGLVLCLGLIGCGRDGAEEFSTWESLIAEDYVVRYPDPPWEHIEDDEETFFDVFEIENSAERAGIASNVPASFRLEVARVGGTPEANAQMEALLAEGDDELSVLEDGGPRELMYDERGGSEVFIEELRAGVFTRQFRHVFITHPSGTLRMSFEASVDLDTEEIEAMVRGAITDREAM